MSDLLADDSFVALGRRILAGRCALFVGAGASIDSGGPSSEELADLIAEKALMIEERGTPLDQIVEYVDGGPGRQAATSVIVERLAGLEPSASLVALAALPWAAAYSVNFDDLLEQAFEQERPGQVQVFYSARDLDSITPNRTPLFQLHGSIRSPNDRQMGLVLTDEDMSRAASQRLAFYRRLTGDLEAHELVFVGFSLSDQDFRRVITELHESVDNRHTLVPRGYALTPHPSPHAANYWDTKKISLLSATLEELVAALADLRSSAGGVSPVAIGTNPLLPRFLSHINPAAPLAFDLASAFEFPELDDGDPTPRVFLRGGPASWATIRERFDAARDISDDLTDALLVNPRDEPVHPIASSTRLVLLEGHAGAGKSTVARRIAWDLAHAWTKRVVWVQQPSRLSLDLIDAALAGTDERLYVFVDDAADAGLTVTSVVSRSRRRGMRVTYVVVERANEWTAATREHPIDPDRTFRLNRISDGEAVGVLSRLERAGELGTLEGLPQDEKVHRLVTRADRQLLVGMREATEDKNFDEIIADEYRNLPNEAARRAYLNVCTLFQFGVPTRAGILSRTTGVPFAALPETILKPALGVLLETQASEWREPTYVARHRVIADIVFRRALPSPAERAMQVQALLHHLDPGYREDARAFSKLINARWLRDRGIEPDALAHIYAMAKRLRPNDPFVVQQEGLSWRFEDRVRADQLLQEAARMAPQSDMIRHSQATLLLDDARTTRSTIDRATLLAKAESQFKELIRREPTNSAPRVSLADVNLLRAEKADDPIARLGHIAAARRVVSDAMRNGVVSSYVLDMAAKVDEASGNLEGAREDYRKAAETAGPDPHLWTTYARFLLRHDGPQAAIEALNQALDLSPIDPQLNHELARTLEQLPESDERQIRRAYDLALAEPVLGHLPELDLAIFLHRRGHYADAADLFAVLRNRDLPNHIKGRPRAWIEGDDGRRTFRARVSSVGHARAFVTIPELPEPTFIPAWELPADKQRIGAEVQVHVLYNCFGPRARLADTPQAEADDTSPDD